MSAKQTIQGWKIMNETEVVGPGEESYLIVWDKAVRFADPLVCRPAKMVRNACSWITFTAILISRLNYVL